MAQPTADDLKRLNVVLEEAHLVWAELDEEDRRFRATLAILTLPEEPGAVDPDPRIQLNLHPVGRLAVSYRRAEWNDPHAPPVPLTVAEVPAVIATFGQLPIYGWEHFDKAAKDFASWSSRLSLDVELGSGRDHTLDLFQEGNGEFIELRVWFSELRIGRARDGSLVEVSIDELVPGNDRWWAAMRSGDPRTFDSGIFPLSG